MAQLFSTDRERQGAMRSVCWALAGFLLTAPAARAGEDTLKGTYKVGFVERGMLVEPWLLKLDRKDGKLVGAIEAAKGIPASTLEGVKLDGKILTFTINLGRRPFQFEGVVGKDAKVILGSLEIVKQVVFPARLELTKLAALEFKQPVPPEAVSFNQAKELLGKSFIDPTVFDTTRILFREAKKEGAKAEDVEKWANALIEAARNYGPRWQREVTLRVADQLANAAADYPAVAENLARRAVKELGAKGGAEAELRGLNLLEQVLNKADKKAEAARLADRISALEPKGHEEALKNLPFTPEKYPPRKNPGRAVLVELFTGAQCPPCVAADLAFDGLEKTFKPSEVVLLQYHLHIPGPDALTNPASEARKEYYGPEVNGTPSTFFNGKPEAGGGGFREHAENKYKEYLKVVKPLLEKPAGAKIEAEAVRKGDQIVITASASDVEKGATKARLRLALVDEWVRYAGSNGLTYHSRVVRAMPGGADGVAVEKGQAKQKVTVDLGELRKQLGDYLDKTGRAFRDGQRPLRFRDLRLVAFVQNDENQEVLHAIEVPVRGDEKK